MKDFDIFIQEGYVKKQIPDMNLSDSLVKDSAKRMGYATSSILTEESAKYIYENIYESLREAADAILFIKGFKSFSHEATISFLQRFKEVSYSEIAQLDRMRIKRNGMKYYGKLCPMDDAREAVEFADRLLKKIIALQKKIRG